MISVIIPVFNRAAFLREAVESVLNQTLFSTPAGPDWELIIIDDGSTDDTAAAARAFEGPVLYRRQPHLGVSAARNHGLRLARGGYVAFLDSDDLWIKDKLQVQMNFMKAFPRALVCYTGETWIRRGVRVNPHEKHRKYSGWIFDKVLPLCLLSLSSALFRKELFDEIGVFDECLPVCEDYDLGIRIAWKHPIHLVPKPLIIKRGGHPGQVSHRHWGMDRYRVQALEKALRLPLTGEQAELVKREIVRKSRILVNGFEKRGKTREAGHYQEICRKYGPAAGPA